MTIGTITYKCWVCGYTVTVHDIACWLKHKLRLMSNQEILDKYCAGAQDTSGNSMLCPTCMKRVVDVRKCGDCRYCCSDADGTGFHCEYDSSHFISVACDCEAPHNCPIINFGMETLDMNEKE